MKFLQLNLGRGTEAQDLLMQTDGEGADVLLISEQHKWSENSVWYQDASRKAEILVCSPDLSIGDFLETHAGFASVEVAGVRAYSCYFSPDDLFEIFETQILLLEESLREASGRSLIADDFNSKSPECGKARLDRRGILVGENDLSENQFGFRKGRSTVDAIQAVVDIATKARRGTGKRKGFCALISMDIRNAFNNARWDICIEAMVRKKVPEYLLRMIDDYLSDSWVIYEGDK